MRSSAFSPIYVAVLLNVYQPALGMRRTIDTESTLSFDTDGTFTHARMNATESTIAELEKDELNGKCHIRHDFTGCNPSKYEKDAVSLEKMFSTRYTRYIAYKCSGDTLTMFICSGEGHEVQRTRAFQECVKNNDNQADGCTVFGPKTIKDACALRFASVKTVGDHKECACNEDSPHLYAVLPSGGYITRDLSKLGGASQTFDADFHGICVDECFASDVDEQWLKQAPAAHPFSQYSKWPVVFLAVYTLQPTFGIVHSNLAFCPYQDILEDPAVKDKVGACHEKNSQESAGGLFGGCKDEHEKVFIEGINVPILLQKHGCKEVVWDGNADGKVWIPEKGMTGCWAQGRKPADYWWQDAAKMGARTDMGYQKLYWLTSENKVSEGALETEMKSCTGSKLGNKLDFNEGTYSLLHHNCNKFSTEAMRFLDLPFWYKPEDKGKHDVIAFSATYEESGKRSMLSGVTEKVFGQEAIRAPLSNMCLKSNFYLKGTNCRRAGWTVPDEGDCPRDGITKKDLKCYDSDWSKGADAGHVDKVDFHDKVNGKCAIPEGQECKLPDAVRKPYKVAPCRPGTQCLAVTEDGKKSYKCTAPGR